MLPYTYAIVSNIHQETTFECPLLILLDSQSTTTSWYNSNALILVGTHPTVIPSLEDITIMAGTFKSDQQVTLVSQFQLREILSPVQLHKLLYLMHLVDTTQESLVGMPSRSSFKSYY